ncbi:uncharacterized protein LOC113210905 [Frankliniella occidentalis]|uniref:Uncharacterized protein LOC113210905 n=1 Tax=Frankliniella occidentalis TaxID=133901 RepID=A0A6J1SUD1_FRAOC|nr:uncharacterized protein LOC113210905 [Frankliniella occidentalis]
MSASAAWKKKREPARNSKKNKKQEYRKKNKPSKDFSQSKEKKAAPIPVFGPLFQPMLEDPRSFYSSRVVPHCDAHAARAGLIQAGRAAPVPAEQRRVRRDALLQHLPLDFRRRLDKELAPRRAESAHVSAVLEEMMVVCKEMRSTTAHLENEAAVPAGAGEVNPAGPEILATEPRIVTTYPEIVPAPADPERARPERCNAAVSADSGVAPARPDNFPACRVLFHAQPGDVPADSEIVRAGAARNNVSKDMDIVLAHPEMVPAQPGSVVSAEPGNIAAEEEQPKTMPMYDPWLEHPQKFYSKRVLPYCKAHPAVPIWARCSKKLGKRHREEVILQHLPAEFRERLDRALEPHKAENAPLMLLLCKMVQARNEMIKSSAKPSTSPSTMTMFDPRLEHPQSFYALRVVPYCKANPRVPRGAPYFKLELRKQERDVLLQHLPADYRERLDEALKPTDTQSACIPLLLQTMIKLYEAKPTVRAEQRVASAEAGSVLVVPTEQRVVPTETEASNALLTPTGREVVSAEAGNALLVPTQTEVVPTEESNVFVVSREQAVLPDEAGNALPLPAQVLQTEQFGVSTGLGSDVSGSSERDTVLPAEPDGFVSPDQEVPQVFQRDTVQHKPWHIIFQELRGEREPEWQPLSPPQKRPRMEPEQTFWFHPSDDAFWTDCAFCNTPAPLDRGFCPSCKIPYVIKCPSKRLYF